MRIYDRETSAFRVVRAYSVHINLGIRIIFRLVKSNSESIQRADAN